MRMTAFAFLIIVTHSTSYPSTFMIDSSKGKISYLAKGRPALISIKGSGHGVSGKLFKKENFMDGEIKLDLSTLDSGIALRDEHLKNKYLEIDKYPSAILKISSLDISDIGMNTKKFTGLLILHGTEKTIEGNYSLKKGDRIEAIKADFSINLSSFNIDIPNFQGITVAENVQVEVDLPVSSVE